MIRLGPASGPANKIKRARNQRSCVQTTRPMAHNRANWRTLTVTQYLCTRVGVRNRSYWIGVGHKRKRKVHRFHFNEGACSHRSAEWYSNLANLKHHYHAQNT